MKKIILFALLFAIQSGMAQQKDSIRSISNKKNEIRVDVFSLVAFSKFNLTVERFLKNNFSVGIMGSMANSNQVNSDFDAGYRNTIPKYEVIPFVRYNLSKGVSSFYFVEVFVSANGGDFRETVLLTDETNTNYYTIQKTKYSDVALGAAVGYKYYIKNQFGLEFLVGFGSNLFNRDKSPDVINRVGLGLSYRF